MELKCDGNTVVWRGKLHTLKVEPWGTDSARVMAAPEPEFGEKPGALLPPGECAEASVEKDGETARLKNGKLTVEIAANGRLRFLKTENGEVLLEEPPVEIVIPPAREFDPLEGRLWRVRARFVGKEGEKFFGLGQHRHGLFDQKGCVVDLRQRNCEVAIPFTLSSRGYGFLWHNPALGRVEFGRTRTRWVAEASSRIDYWVTTGDWPAEIMSHYANATGHAPEFPEWASGFWQCKLRYKTREELVETAREYRRRKLPLSVIVIDFFHWPRNGDLCFDGKNWPDPESMVAELENMGVKTMVSIWPCFNTNSRNFDEFRNKGCLLKTKIGTTAASEFIDTYDEGKVYDHYYDPSNPGARKLLWEKVRDGYYRQGFRVFWLDSCEPGLKDNAHENTVYHIGEGSEVACLYPFLHVQGFYEGMKAEGESEIIFLCRSAWAGSQRFAAAVWSGDIKSTFEVLTGQVRAGLNMAVSGIPWWTTDIGGFHSGDPSTPYFRELIVRWFQYGVFCPLFRLHGVREPVIDHKKGGGPNEVWSFGEEAYGIITKLLLLRERLRPYVMEGMRTASAAGMPLMRPLFFDFPEDEACWNVDDQFMFGPDIMVSPVTFEGEREREVYLPAGTSWIDVSTGAETRGGRTLRAEAPLERIPVYLRKGANLSREIFSTETRG
ncbi:MAG: glycoside hydrolase family 31 protein [Kiritimatiellia bacterium]